MQHLKEEAEFLKQVSASIEPELKKEVERNLSIARERYKQLTNMTVYDYYLARVENPKFPSQMAILPYFSKDRAQLAVNSKDVGGIDFNANNLD